jgi:two-component system heavy metal sensor histidine kinase CusS
MKSTRFALFASFSILVAIAVGAFALITWIDLSRAMPAGSKSPISNLPEEWLIFETPVLLFVLLGGWVLTKRSGLPAKNLASRLSQQLTQSGPTEIPMLDSDREYRDLTRAINKLLESNQQTNERLSNFSAKVAHELRAPITLLQLQIDYAASKLDSELADGIRAQIKRLTDYVDTALLVARAEHGKLPISKEVVDLPEVISKLLEPYQVRAKVQRRTLDVALAPVGSIELDSRIFGLIFNNLISNAFFHGTGEIRIDLRRKGRFAVLFLENKIRIRPNAAPTLEAGTGMGLNTVETLVAAHGGLVVRTRKLQDDYIASIRAPVLHDDNSR